MGGWNAFHGSILCDRAACYFKARFREHNGKLRIAQRCSLFRNDFLQYRPDVQAAIEKQLQRAYTLLGEQQASEGDGR